ncbi:MAG: T9SS type A sorting domain-containing protein [Flavitalea sp.]
MKTKFNYLATFILILCTNVLTAQTYTMNWGTNFSPAWTAGSSATRTTTSIGASGVTATVALTSNESTAMSSVTAFSSPMVSSAGNPFTTQLGSNVANLALAMDLNANTSYVDVKIDFSSAVNNVTFNIADIDKVNSTSTTYFDEVLVTGSNGVVSVTPSLSKHNGTSQLASRDSVLISGNIARANTTSGVGSNSPSTTTDQNATVTVNFGSTSITTMTIRYRNATGAQANPAAQAIAIGNISFSQNTLILPVVLTSFNAHTKNNGAEITWSTSQEAKSEKFLVEKSTDGKIWNTITTVAAAKSSTTTKNYSAFDATPEAVNYYRLKQVDIDGTFTYSKTVTLTTSGGNKIEAKVYPNPVTSAATVSINSPASANATIALFNIGGVKISSVNTNLEAGYNNIALANVSTLKTGTYLVIVTNTADKSQDTFKFVKQ